MKKIFATAIVVTLLVMVLPISPYPFGNPSYYNYMTNSLLCVGAYECRHEIGHRMDAENGHPSRTYEFGHAIELYLYVELHHDQPSKLSLSILTYPPLMVHRAPRFPITSSGQEELYADMYAWVDGETDKLPEIFREFYSQDAKYQKLYDCLMSKPVKLCGPALHVEKR